MPGPANPDVAWAIEDIRKRLPGRQKALDYYEDRHPLHFTESHNKGGQRFRELFNDLHDNLCDDVVDEPTDRLQIDGWTGTQGDAAKEWWTAQKGEARAGSVHKDAHRGADGFAIVWDVDGDGVARLYVQDPRQMAVRYSVTEPDRQEVAAKCWRSGKGYRLNLYYPPDERREGDPRGRVERYFSRGQSNSDGTSGIPNATAFLPYKEGDPNDPTGFRDWIEHHDKPGSGVFHFPNGEPGAYGRSVLEGVYSLQNAMNKLLADFIVAAEASAKPKRWGTGIEVPTDPVTGKQLAAFKEEDDFWWTKAKEGNFGGFPLPEVVQLLKSMDALALKIARAGGLPPWAVSTEDGTSSGESGLSRLLLEGRLVKHCKDRQRDWGPAWRELVAFALTINGTSTTATQVEPSWAPVETRDETAELERLVLKKTLVGSIVPDSYWANELGITEDELRELAAKKEQEDAEKMEAAQQNLGGRISQPGQLPPANPAPPVQPNGAAQPGVPQG